MEILRNCRKRGRVPVAAAKDTGTTADLLCNKEGTDTYTITQLYGAAFNGAEQGDIKGAAGKHTMNTSWAEKNNDIQNKKGR